MRTKNPAIVRLYLFFLIIGGCLGLIECEKGTIKVEYTGSVEGFVIDSLTRTPIDSAWISINPDTLNPPNTYTDSAGYFSLVRVTGTHRFHYCGKSGYITKKTEEYKINIDKTTRVDIELVPIKE